MLKEELVKKNYPHAFVGHGFDHVQRVHNLAIKIAKQEKNIDLEIIDAAAWFHDIARHKEDLDGVCHAEEGSKMVKKVLAKLNFTEDKIEKVSYAIKVHRYSKGIIPETKEAKILQDADRLDAIGAVSIARVFSYGGHKGRAIYTQGKENSKDNSTSIGHFYKKIIKLKPAQFHTQTARKIAKQRYDFIILFLKKFQEETR